MTREEALKYAKLRLQCYSKGDGGYTEHGEFLAAAIKALQEPKRKKGQWKGFDDYNSYRCTACGEIWALNDGTPEENNMNYCPNCGADMRGKKDE